MSNSNQILWEIFIEEAVLNEEKTPAEQAHELGLKHRGYGYWENDAGEVVARTVDGHLVKYDTPLDKDSLETSADGIDDYSDEITAEGADAIVSLTEKIAKFVGIEPSHKLTSLIVRTIKDKEIPDRALIYSELDNDQVAELKNVLMVAAMHATTKVKQAAIFLTQKAHQLALQNQKDAEKAKADEQPAFTQPDEPEAVNEPIEDPTVNTGGLDAHYIANLIGKPELENDQQFVGLITKLGTIDNAVGIANLSQKMKKLGYVDKVQWKDILKYVKQVKDIKKGPVQAGKHAEGKIEAILTHMQSKGYKNPVDSVYEILQDKAPHIINTIGGHGYDLMDTAINASTEGGYSIALDELSKLKLSPTDAKILNTMVKAAHMVVTKGEESPVADEEPVEDDHVYNADFSQPEEPVIEPETPTQPEPASLGSGFDPNNINTWDEETKEVAEVGLSLLQSEFFEQNGFDLELSEKQLQAIPISLAKAYVAGGGIILEKWVENAVEIAVAVDEAGPYIKEISKYITKKLLETGKEVLDGGEPIDSGELLVSDKDAEAIIHSLEIYAAEKFYPIYKATIQAIKNGISDVDLKDYLSTIIEKKTGEEPSLNWVINTANALKNATHAYYNKDKTTTDKPAQTYHPDPDVMDNMSVDADALYGDMLINGGWDGNKFDADQEDQLKYCLKIAAAWKAEGKTDNEVYKLVKPYAEDVLDDINQNAIIDTVFNDNKKGKPETTYADIDKTKIQDHPNFVKSGTDTGIYSIITKVEGDHFDKTGTSFFVSGDTINKIDAEYKKALETGDAYDLFALLHTQLATDDITQDMYDELIGYFHYQLKNHTYGKVTSTVDDTPASVDPSPAVEEPGIPAPTSSSAATHFVTMLSAEKAAHTTMAKFGKGDPTKVNPVKVINWVLGKYKENTKQLTFYQSFAMTLVQKYGLSLDDVPQVLIPMTVKAEMQNQADLQSTPKVAEPTKSPQENSYKPVIALSNIASDYTKSYGKPFSELDSEHKIEILKAVKAANEGKSLEEIENSIDPYMVGQVLAKDYADFAFDFYGDKSKKEVSPSKSEVTQAELDSLKDDQSGDMVEWKKDILTKAIIAAKNGASYPEIKDILTPEMAVNSVLTKYALKIKDNFSKDQPSQSNDSENVKEPIKPQFDPEELSKNLHTYFGFSFKDVVPEYKKVLLSAIQAAQEGKDVNQILSSIDTSVTGASIAKKYATFAQQYYGNTATPTTSTVTPEPTVVPQPEHIPEPVEMKVDPTVVEKALNDNFPTFITGLNDEQKDTLNKIVSIAFEKMPTWKAMKDIIKPMIFALPGGSQQVYEKIKYTAQQEFNKIQGANQKAKSEHTAKVEAEKAKVKAAEDKIKMDALINSMDSSESGNIVKQFLTKAGNTLNSDKLGVVLSMVDAALNAKDSQELIDRLNSLRSKDSYDQSQLESSYHITSTQYNALMPIVAAAWKHKHDPQHATQEPSVNIDSQERAKYVYNNWVKQYGMGIGHVPTGTGEQNNLKNAIQAALSEPDPSKVNGILNHLLFKGTSLNDERIGQIKKLVHAERQNPGSLQGKSGEWEFGEHSPEKVQAPVSKPKTSEPTPYGDLYSDPAYNKASIYYGIPYDKKQDVHDAIVDTLSKFVFESNKVSYAKSLAYKLKSFGMDEIKAKNLANWATREAMKKEELHKKAKEIVQAKTKNDFVDPVTSDTMDQVKNKAFVQSLTSSYNAPLVPVAKTEYVPGEKIKITKESKFRWTAPENNHIENVQNDKTEYIQYSWIKENVDPELFKKFTKVSRAWAGGGQWSKNPNFRKAMNHVITSTIEGPPPCEAPIAGCIERGMHMTTQNFSEYIKAFRIGEKCYIGPSGFTTRRSTASSFGHLDTSGNDEVKVLLRVLPSKNTGKIRCAMIQRGEGVGEEHEVICGTNDHTRCVDVIKHVYMNGGVPCVGYELILQYEEPGINESVDSPKIEGFNKEYWKHLSRETVKMLIKYNNSSVRFAQ